MTQQADVPEAQAVPTVEIETALGAETQSGLEATATATVPQSPEGAPDAKSEVATDAAGSTVEKPINNNDGQPEAVAPEAPVTEVDDLEWTLEWITITRLQPIIEAFDDDASGFITVAEVNRFTTSRPRDWRYSGSSVLQLSYRMLIR